MIWHNHELISTSSAGSVMCSCVTSAVMEPHSWLMRVSWCCSVFPCMMGLLVHISAMMQPPPHRSMGGP